MKITAIEAYPVWGGHRNFLFVVVDTDEGIYGVGEAGLTGRELAVIGAIDQRQSPSIQPRSQSPRASRRRWLFTGH